ncbi:MAG TPA: hypothetical protein DEE98_08020 [Elusimicrobia bacterium]|nr:MAG: hypothetical protein A2278_09375 [Elusimicrobia bacterium RIFOXYA12_FULL_49_49]OGS09182.1 MAG: hypothetical protein A2204_05040 [Elusimicrobia bacterium RIFOXYA1_FULL_47_7]OGS14992.1 MAG: hypothetical protein A2251_08230 [Elusimicrobia bacterium RIFOXYA2_FULL_47_53]OGS26073.1 MAG: hypothetical protein A2339_02045 [Elusimicrobia bacterium RIFOXYB12_FULL_50_12]OGS29336.1 MAG: hypothetical protein A2323_04160 [Elusimicrobia bacterium RIFOXYB2_FULL_46_23]HBU70309.1 hypothetical protein [El
MKKTLLFKIFSGYIFITLALSGMIVVFSFNTIRQYYINSLTAELVDLCRVAAPRAEAYLKSNDRGALNRYISETGERISKRLTIVDSDGTVLADSQKDPASMGNHRNRPEIAQAFGGASGTAIRFSSTVQEEMLYVAVPVSGARGGKAVIRASIYLKDVNKLLAEIRLRIIYATGVILAVSLFGAFLFSKSLSSPIEKLKYAAGKLAGGDFKAKVDGVKSGELAGLAEGFNNMSAKINDLFAELSKKQNELNTIINTIPEGLFVVDSGGRLSRCNSAFRAIAASESAEGRFLWEVARSEGLRELVESVKAEGREGSGEVELNAKTYLTSVSPLGASGELVAVMHDITDIKNLENRKKEFVANVSHELKTPLTVIKGFAETLESEVSESGRRYLDIISGHTDRLINIVKDLLLLSELEAKGFVLNAEPVDLKVLASNVAGIFENAAREKNIALKLEIKSNISAIKGDPFKLEQVFTNLIDNAIKYSEKGEVLVSLFQDKTHTMITVSDNGFGISVESLPHIFERFYVADKSRSRKAGGTGLGLAIVKHIVMLHNGHISVESTPQVGSNFTVTLPQG